MKLINNNSSRNFEGKEHIQMGLDLENTSVIMNMLRNNIYTDPINSLVRELYSNAVDAHNRVNNIYDFIEIDIKEELQNNIFSIRDYGASMNKEIISNVYSKMGKSDKRNTNGEHGGWGLGCKSPLAYTDYFWIETFTIENNKSIYRKWVQYIDSTKVGALTLLEENEENNTEFKTGTKVSVPFNIKDLDKIIQSLDTYLTYTKTKFKLLNNYLKDKLNLVKPTYNFYGETWAIDLIHIYSHKELKPKSLAVIHDIPYVLDLNLLYTYLPNFKDSFSFIINKFKPAYIKSEINSDLFNSFLQCLSLHSFEITLSIGSLDVSASRETLQYTEKTCVELYKHLYKMFIEFYQNLRVDLINHPNLIEACINYEKFPDTLKRKVLSKLKWYKENISFSSKYPIFTNNYICDVDFRQYKMETAYSNKNNRYEDVLKKHNNEVIYTGKYKYILCIQDSSCKNYGKYLKYYLKSSLKADLYKTYIICITPNDLQHVHNWIIDSLPTVYVSDLILEFNKTSVKASPNRTKEGFFKCLRFYSERKRTRAKGIHCFLNDSVADKTPVKPQYYLNEEEVLNMSTDFRFISSFNIGDVDAYIFISSFNNYLKEKDININDVFFTPKLTRNFKDKNWVNILDIIKNDYTNLKSYINTYSKNLFIYNYARVYKPIFNLFHKEELWLKDSLYTYISNEINISRIYLQKNKLLGELTLLVRPDIYAMNYKLDRPHLDTFEDFKVPSEIEDVCLEFFNECDKYIKSLPFLVIHEKNKYIKHYVNIDKKSFLTYINIMEKELNLQKEIEGVSTPSINSDFVDLITKLETKFLVKEEA